MNSFPNTSLNHDEEVDLAEKSYEDNRIESLLQDLEFMDHDRRTIEKRFNYAEGFLDDYALHKNKVHLISVLESYKEMAESGELIPFSDNIKTINAFEENMELVTILENTIEDQKKYILFLEYELKKILPDAPDNLYEMYKKNQIAQFLKRS